jgi:hypothetical protein
LPTSSSIVATSNNVTEGTICQSQAKTGGTDMRELLYMGNNRNIKEIRLCRYRIYG